MMQAVLRLLSLCCAVCSVHSLDSRTVYLVRHGEAVKNTQQSGSTPSAVSTMTYDMLTQNGRSQVGFTFHTFCISKAPARRDQAMATARRLANIGGIRSAVSAPEERTHDTALAITLYCGIPFATVDGDLTSKKYDSESAEARARRGIAAVDRALDRTSGDLVVVSHGHVIEYATLLLTGQDVNGPQGKYELVNAGVVTFRVQRDGSGRWQWTKLASDGLVRDE